MIWSKLLLDAVQGCLLGRVTGPWDFVQTLQGRQSAPQSFQIGCILISCKGGSTLVFYDQMLNIGAEFRVFIVICKSWLFLITLDSLLISTLDCKFFVPFRFFLNFNYTVCLVCDILSMKFFWLFKCLSGQTLLTNITSTCLRFQRALCRKTMSSICFNSD